MEILDASAILAFIKKEQGGEKVQKLIEGKQRDGLAIFIHSINYIELICKCAQIYDAITTKHIIADLQSPWLGIMNYMDTDLTMYAAHLKTNYQLSLGDATGLAYTKIMKGHFWTADKALLAIAQKEKIALCLIR